MSFSEAVERQQQAVFDRLGSDADWQDVGTVRVCLREADESVRLTYGELVATGRMIRVRRSEVAEPAEGQTIQMLDDNGDQVADGLFEVAGEPRLDRKRVWHCQVIPAA